MRVVVVEPDLGLCGLEAATEATAHSNSRGPLAPSAWLRRFHACSGAWATAWSARLEPVPAGMVRERGTATTWPIQRLSHQVRNFCLPVRLFRGDPRGGGDAGGQGYPGTVRIAAIAEGLS